MTSETNHAASATRKAWARQKLTDELCAACCQGRPACGYLCWRQSGCLYSIGRAHILLSPEAIGVPALDARKAARRSAVGSDGTALPELFSARSSMRRLSMRYQCSVSMHKSIRAVGIPATEPSLHRIPHGWIEGELPRRDTPVQGSSVLRIQA